jgi:hypothetical protein
VSSVFFDWASLIIHGNHHCATIAWK